jgi:hypothetical protein
MIGSFIDEPDLPLYRARNAPEMRSEPNFRGRRNRMAAKKGAKKGSKRAAGSKKKKGGKKGKR